MKKLVFIEHFIEDLQLDIVGFLAILGEGSVTANLQVATLSKLVFIPRLLPAPQVFLRPSRATQLERNAGNVTGVHSGNDKDYINYIGHVVLDAESMPDYSVRCVRIVKNGNGKVKAKTKGPLSILVFLGCAESIAILVVSILNSDGMALLAVLLLSFLSTLAGLSNWWTLSLPKRGVKLRNKTKKLSAPTTPPKGDVVIRYPNGSFLVVECEENVARELYFAPENVFYLIESPWLYRLMSLGGTLMLMMGIVTLGNSQNVQQIVFAGAYMLLNAAYWIVAALPPRYHWDLSAFEIKKQRLSRHAAEQISAYKDDDDDDSVEFDFDEEATEKEKAKARKIKREAAETYTDLNPTFTHAMWKAIVATQSIAWVKKNDALPETPVWHEWLRDALHEAKKSRISVTDNDVKTYTVPEWEPLAHFYKLLDQHNRNSAVPSAHIKEADDSVFAVDAVTATPSAVDDQEELSNFIPSSVRRQGTELSG